MKIKCLTILLIILGGGNAFALTEDEIQAKTICMIHAKKEGGTFDNYAKNATYEPGYDICEKLLPTLLTLEAAETADWEYQQEVADNSKLAEVAKQILPNPKR
jgi:hypothetical protein